MTIAAEGDGVIAAATQHAVAVHEHEDNGELRSLLQENLKDEVPA